MSSDITDMITTDEKPHTCCSIIPPYVLSRIADHPDCPIEARTWARESLLHTNTLNQIRDDAVKLSTRRWHAAGAVKRLDRKVYSCCNTEVHDQLLLRAEGDAPSGEAAVNECYDYFGATFEFFSDILNRNSIDDRGMSIIGSVNYGRNYTNALWMGTHMVFGDGDGGIYWNRFTASMDVVGHELTHGVTQYTAGLVYQGESGALNESMSDVFGSMVKQHYLHQTATEADWLIGAEILGPRFQGIALRSMKSPGTAYDDPVLGRDEQIAHYDQVLATPYSDDYDCGGVHIYSGVPNLAFYLAATALGGHSWERAGKIWYATLTDNHLSSTASFMEFADLTCQHAESLFDSSVREIVEHAWSAVGLDSDSTKTSTIKGTWTGSRTGYSMECRFIIVDQVLQGWGTSTAGGKSSTFIVVNGHVSDDGSIKFTADYTTPNTSNVDYEGTLSGNTISGRWECLDRQPFAVSDTGLPLRNGPFTLTRRA